MEGWRGVGVGGESCSSALASSFVLNLASFVWIEEKKKPSRINEPQSGVTVRDFVFQMLLVALFHTGRLR